MKEVFISKKHGRLDSLTKTLSLLALLLSLAAPVSGQTGAAEEMRKLDFLVGEWKGKGSMFGAQGGGGPEMSQRVKVKRESDGSLRVKETRSFRLPNVVFGGADSHTSASNDATVYYDEAAQLFRWRRDKDRKNPSELKLVGPQTIQWQQRSDIGAARVTVRVTDSGDWHETMEFWSNQGGWQKAAEAVLRREK